MSLETDPPPHSRKDREIARVLQELEELCGSLRSGERISTHTELMRRLGASERTVLRALDELRRAGKIVRRNGVGTFVADRGQSVLPNAPIVASSLADSRTIVAVARPDHSFFDRCMELLFQHAEAAGLALACRLIDPETSPFLAPPAAQSRPLGFILLGYRLASLAKGLQDAGCRVALLGAPPAEVTPEVPCVYGDHEEGGYVAARHLLDLGHRRLAFVGDDDLEQTLRWRGHQRALEEARRACGEVVSGIIRPHDVTAWAKEPALAAAYFARPDAPTGLVVWNDHEAAKLLALLIRAGVSVPDAVSLVGYDDLPEGRLVYPPLTTVDHAIGQQLQAALALLTRPVPPPPSHTVVVLPSLVPRRSSAPPRRGGRGG